MNIESQTKPLSFSLELAQSEGVAAMMPRLDEWRSKFYGDFVLQAKTTLSVDTLVATKCNINTVVMGYHGCLGVVMTVESERGLLEMLEMTEKRRNNPTVERIAHSVSIDLFRVLPSGLKEKFASIASIKNCGLTKHLGMDDGLYVVSTGTLVEVQL